MLRVRDIKGDTRDLEESWRFVELCDSQGALMVLVYEDAEGSFIVSRPGDREFEQYTRLFRVKDRASRTIRLDLKGDVP